MNIHALQAIFFDFDGVLLDSTRIKTEAFRKLYAGFGEEIVVKVVIHHQQHGGISRVEKIDYYHRCFLNTPLTPEALKALSQEFSENVKDLVIQAAWIPGAQEFILSFYHRVDLYIVSGTPQFELVDIIKQRGLESYFRAVLGSPVKKPEHVRNILRQRHLKPGNCLFVGDAITDLNTAVETGLRFIGIQGEVEFPANTIVLPDCKGLAAAIGTLGS
jgi:phosphoglycolate phosphatase-like HAD superfamily hydrolase